MPADHQLPEPVYPIADLYENDGQYRRIRLSSAVLHDLDQLLERMSERLATATLSQYTPYVRQYWSITTAAGRDPHALSSLKDWVYALAYPRLAYLRRPVGLPSDPARYEPGLSQSSLKVAVAAVAGAWAAAGIQPPQHYPEWKSWWPRLQRLLKQEPDRKAPILRDELLAMLARTDKREHELVRLRDRALLLLAWSAALSGQELVAVQVEHLQQRGEEWFLHVPGKGRYAAGAEVPLYPSSQPDRDPVSCLQEFWRQADINTGPAFRSIDRFGRIGKPKPMSRQAITNLVSRYCDRDDVSAQSLRIGFIAQAAADGIEEWRIRRIARYETGRMVDIYRRSIQPRSDNARSLL